MYVKPQNISLTGKVAEWSKAHGLGFFICLRVSKEARVRTPPLPYFFLFFLSCPLRRGCYFILTLVYPFIILRLELQVTAINVSRSTTNNYMPRGGQQIYIVSPG